MSKKNACVLLYPDYQDARQAVEKLQAHSFNTNTVSIIGRAEAEQKPHFDAPAGGKKIYFQNITAQSWKHLWALPGGALFFTLADFGSLITAGSIVALLTQKEEDMDINNRFTVLATALFNMGVPGKNIKQYEDAVKAEKIMLTINGTRSEVEQACHILHNETQQATVHIA